MIPNKVIAAMDTLGNIFIPTSGRSSALKHAYCLGLVPARREHPHFDMHLFGYPEWQAYTQDFLANFYELDTYFYFIVLYQQPVSGCHQLHPVIPPLVQQRYVEYLSFKYGMLRKKIDVGYFFLKGLSQQGNKLEENLNRVQVTPIQTERPSASNASITGEG